MSDSDPRARCSDSEPPVFANAVCGYRIWRLDDEHQSLCSIGGGAYSIAWQRGDNHAYCSLHREVPDPDCRCGLYCFHELQAAQRHYGSDQRAALGIQQMYGVIAGRGRAAVHHDGLRVEQARILALATGPNVSAEQGQEVAAAYDVPLVEVAQLADVARAHGVLEVAADNRPDRDESLSVLGMTPRIHAMPARASAHLSWPLRAFSRLCGWLAFGLLVASFFAAYEQTAQSLVPPLLLGGALLAAFTASAVNDSAFMSWKHSLRDAAIFAGGGGTIVAVFCWMAWMSVLQTPSLEAPTIKLADGMVEVSDPGALKRTFLGAGSEATPQSSDVVYQWQRCTHEGGCESVPGARASSYRVRPGDQRLRLQAIASNLLRTTRVYSNVVTVGGKP